MHDLIMVNELFADYLNICIGHSDMGWSRSSSIPRIWICTSFKKIAQSILSQLATKVC